MNKKEYKKVVTLYKAGKVPEKLIVEMILHSVLGRNLDDAMMEELIAQAAIFLDVFYKTEVLTCEK